MIFLLRSLCLCSMAMVIGAADPAADPDGIAFFEAKIRPVLAEKCYECHSAAKKIKAKLSLDSRAGVLEGGETGPAIVSGDPEHSLLIKAIRYHDEDLQMPPKQQLSAAVIADFVAWIKRGAPDPRNAAPSAVSRFDDATVKNHWAYRPLVRPPVPNVKDQSKALSPVDHFIRAAQEAAKVTPAAPAERRVLIRRLYFDLIGIPPTPEEVDAFVSDTSPKATEELVDRLLASPRFGERWARHWLDLARFAESHGYEQDYDRVGAYHYRDFVIQALNEDLPYTTFTTWQLAGDEVAPDNDMALKATGFLAAGVWPTQITKNEVAKSRYDALDDMLSTTFGAMLGTTVGCARCHDHKLDPITQKEYYQLLSTFTTTVRTVVDRDYSPATLNQQIAEFRNEQKSLEEKLRVYEKDVVPKRFAEVSADTLGRIENQWIIQTPVEKKSAGGATITAQADGSLLLSGKNPEMEKLTFTLVSDLTDVTGFRIEALADPSLKKHGPGRADNGNFSLTDVKIVAQRKAGGESVAVVLRDPKSTFDQAGLEVTKTIDNDLKSGWAIDPQFGKNHAAVFTFSQPAGFPGGTRWTVTLRFEGNAKHVIGRPRLSLTTKSVSLDDSSITDAIAQIVRTPTAKWTEAQRQEVMTWWRSNDPGWRKLRDEVDAHAKTEPQRVMTKVQISSEGLPAVRHHTQGEDFFTKTYHLRRGDPNQQQEVAKQAFWSVFGGSDPTPWQQAPPAGARTSHRRAALARWIIDVDHGAGRLLARVEVNRIWQHVFGKALAGTPSDFGLKGLAPTHPELLDWLATEFMAGGWKIKPLIRALVLSSTYAQAGTPTADAVKNDPQNQLFTRHQRQRLEAEAIRDTMLSLGGLLDTRMYGPGTLDQENTRRSIYFFIKRSALIPFLIAFDFPEPLQSVGERPATIVAPQALALMNNPQARVWANGFSKRISSAGDDAATVKMAWSIATGRQPSAEEIADGVAFLVSQTKARGDRAKALADLTQVVMCMSEVIYVD